MVLSSHHLSLYLMMRWDQHDTCYHLDGFLKDKAIFHHSTRVVASTGRHNQFATYSLNNPSLTHQPGIPIRRLKEATTLILQWVGLPPALYRILLVGKLDSDIEESIEPIGAQNHSTGERYFALVLICCLVTLEKISFPVQVQTSLAPSGSNIAIDVP
mmetsp:Transcript_19367/g.31172  ORF Transcript_19367/g.31172 Transcript_19367/m.31172 type:complete len:158 (+) Transcript_19367:331-804(+)